MREGRQYARPLNTGRAAAMRHPARAGVLVGLLGATALSAPAAAQDDDGLYWAERLGNRITVSATRSPVAVDEVPATVTVITAEQIADEMATDIKDLVRFEPGVSVRRAPARFGAALGTTGRSGNEGFTIRGIGGNRVLIQVDGIRSPQGFEFGAQDAGRGGYTDIGLVKSVEILRGPGSALYGSDGLSGVVSFTTSDPADLLQGSGDLGGFARAQYNSSDDEFSETAAVAGRTGNISALLAYTRRDFAELDNQGAVGGTGESRTEPNPQDGQSDALLGKLVWTGGGHRVRFTGEYLQREVHSDILSGQGPVFFGPAPSWIVDSLTADDSTERKRASLDWTWEGDGAVEYAHVAAYWQDGEDVQFALEERSPVGATPRPDRERLNTFDNRVWGIAAEARSDFATGAIGHRLAYGGDVSWTNQRGIRDGTEPPFGESFPTSAFPETDFMLGGVFLGDEIDLLGGGLTLFPALRFDFYELDPRDDPLYPALSQAGQEDSRVSPKFGAVAKLGGNVRLFGNYAQGFRAPTPFQVNNFFENLAFGYTSLPNPDLGPERSESWEGGVRYVSDGFSISGTAFTADYADFIAQAVVGGSFTPTDPAVFQYVNIGKARIEGLEAKADLALDNGITGRFAVAYAKGDEIPDGGARIPLNTIDPVTVVAGLGYREPGGRFGGELMLTHHAAKDADRTDSVECGGPCFAPGSSTVLDLTAFLRITDNLTARAGVFNITDESYALWGDVRGLAASSTVTDAYTRPGRNASVSLTARF
jgi:hemoglobin/transferrin/lactoferrin receptor protein